MAKSSLQSRLVRSVLPGRVKKYTILNRNASRMPTDMSSKLLSTIKAPQGSVEDTILKQKEKDLEKRTTIPTQAELIKQNLDLRMKNLMDEGKKLKMILKQLSFNIKNKSSNT